MKWNVMFVENYRQVQDDQRRSLQTPNDGAEKQKGTEEN